MTALQEAERLLPRLSRTEKAVLARRLVSELGDVFTGIESHPEVCGGEACVVRTRIPVWVLEQARRLGVGQDDLLRCYPTLRPDDITEAWAYAAAHTAEMDQQIRENEAA